MSSNIASTLTKILGFQLHTYLIPSAVYLVLFWDFVYFPSFCMLCWSEGNLLLTQVPFILSSGVQSVVGFILSVQFWISITAFLAPEFLILLYTLQLSEFSILFYNFLNILITDILESISNMANIWIDLVWVRFFLLIFEKSYILYV